MNKPFSVTLADFSAGLVNLINSSGLPPQVIGYCLQNAEREVLRIAERQLENDRAMYAEQCRQQEDQAAGVENTEENNDTGI